MSDVSALDAQSTAGKQAVFSPPNDASTGVQARIADLCDTGANGARSAGPPKAHQPARDPDLSTFPTVVSPSR